MALSKENLTVEIVLDSSGAIKGIKDLEGKFLEFDKVVKGASSTTRKANEETTRIKQMFEQFSSTLGKAAMPLFAVQAGLTAASAAFGALSNTVGGFVNDFAEAERVQRLLTQAIDNAGGRIMNSADAWSEYLEQLQKVKNVDAGVLRGLTAQAIQMGFSEKQTKSLIEASIGLSKITGESLDSAFQKLLGTTRGMAKALTTMVPELQNMTEAELQSGAAFDLVNAKFSSAADGSGTYTSALKASQFAAGGLSEDIGKLIVETFNLTGVLQSATNFINNLRNAMAAVDVQALVSSFKQFMLILAPVGAVVLGITAYMTGFGAAALAVVAPIAIMTAKVTLIATAVLAAVAAVEMIVRNLKLFDEVLAVIGKSILLAIIKPIELANKAIAWFFGLLGDNALARKFNETVENITAGIQKLKGEISDNTETIKKNFDSGFSGQVFKQGMNFVKGFTGETDKADASLKKLGETGARVKVIDEQALQKAQQILKDVQKMTEQLRAETASMGADEKQQIDLKLKAQIASIDARETELKALGGLNKAQRSAIADARIAAVEQAEAARQALASKQFTEQKNGSLNQLNSLMQQTNALEEKNNLAGKEGIDLVLAQFEAEWKKIDALEQQLALTGALGEEQQKQIERARAAATGGVEIAIKGEEKKGAEESAKKAADEAKKTADMYSGIISSAASGADAVVGNAINQIGAAFGPEGQMIAGAVNLLRQGGEKMKELGTGIFQIIEDLPTQLVEGAIGLIEGLVEGFVNLFGDPAAIDAFINNLITALPKINKALMKAFITLTKILLDPKFWIQIAESLVVALVDAIVMAFKSLGDLFDSIFSGDIFSGMDGAVEDVEKSTEKMGQTVVGGITAASMALTGFSQQLFSVQEDIAAPQGRNAQKVDASAIVEAHKKGNKETSKTWKWIENNIIKPLKQLGTWIWEGVSRAGEYIWGLIEPLMEIVMKSLVGAIQVAMEVVTYTFKAVGIMLETTWNVLMAVLKGVWNTLMAVFQTIWNVGVALFEGVINYLKAAWDGIIKVLKAVWDFVVSIFDAIVNSFKAVFNFIVTLFDDPIKAFEQLWEDLKSIFSDLWESIKGIGTALWDAISGIGKAVLDMFKGVGGAIWEGLKSFGSAIWDMFSGVGGAIWEGVKKGWNAIVGLFSNVGNILKDSLSGVFDSIANFFKNLFKFDGGGTDTVENFLGIDFPWIKFAEGGKVPGSARVFGDSEKNDTVPALLSPGEFVIPRSKLQSQDNLKLLDAIMNGGTQKKSMGEWIEKSKRYEVQNYGFGSWIEENVVKPVKENVVDPIAGGVSAVGNWIGDVLVPDDIKKLWDSLVKYVSNIDLKRLVTDPLGMITDAIKGSLGFLVEPFMKMMSMNLGGFVGGTGLNDSVPAMLTPGEYVINRNAVQALGTPFLNALNTGSMGMGGAAPEAPVFNINLNIETRDALDENFIRQKLIPTIKQEIRSSSLRGEFLVSSKGIR